MKTVGIVGAGPTGLTLACCLARQGVRVRVLEQAAAFATGSRGKTLNARSQEALADLGILDRLTAGGRTHLPFRKYFGGEFIADTDPYADARPTPGTPYPTGLFLPQWKVEGALRELLAELGGQVELDSRLDRFEQGPDGVRVLLADGRTLTADHLVGCDGGRSTVRKQLGIPLEGTSDPEFALVVGDVEVAGLEPDAWHQWFGPEGALMLCPFPGESVWQLQATPEVDADGAPLPPSLESFQRLVEQRTGRRDIRLSRATWLTTWRVNVRMVDRYRVGRVLLAGDSAHVHPIAGGLGMNTGIQDAWNLGWKLGHVLTGLAGPGLLDTYQEERLPVAAWTLGVSSAGMAAVAEGVRTPGVGVEAGRLTDTSGLTIGYRDSSLAEDLLGGPLRAGDRAPDAPYTAPDGTPTRLFETFAGSHFTLLGFGPDSRPALTGLAPHVRPLALAAGPGSAADPDSHVRRAYGIEGDALVLVRPDNHVALTVPAGPGAHDTVRAYLAAL
ncbi:FAD-dependent monooxygenase [Kitasatospora sp. MBT63]|uniref:FAD-dependent monooxygenase n=1 Tax=Kitasatospora sp. MBT63 TaxID=1444768 RepID=UPI00053B53DC|nr:FAD-dependent monooxygenase [Kitasatospora sp. MBT63]